MLTKVCFLLSMFPVCVSLLAEFVYRLEEEKEPKTFIGDVGKEYKQKYSGDPESQQHWFNLLSADDSNSSFLITKDGKLYSTKKLDAETLCIRNTQCYLMIKVASRFGNFFRKSIKVKVILQDINDHQPVFPESQIDVQFSENDPEGKLVLVPNAVDRDVSLANSQIVYSLRKGPDEPFALSSIEDGTSELNIYLEGKLDREQKDSYTIQVVAEDTGNPPRRSVLDVNVKVTDENDNKPVFSQSVYNVTIKNQAYGLTPIANVFATDLDIGKNGEISYHLSSQTSKFVRSHFKLNKISGEIFLRKKFPSDKNASYKLFVKAMDSGYARLTTITLVLVNVVSSQNSPPKISVDFLISKLVKNVTPIPIPEDIGVGSFIAYVTVIDKDLGDNGEVNCNLQSDRFQLESIGQKEYKVTIKSPLDRETTNRHDIVIACHDNGIPRLYNERKFPILVVDVNDMQPQFSKEIFKFWTYENQKSNFPVGFINATDQDEGPSGELIYSLLANSKHYLPFQIASNGLISTTEPLDHEFQDAYEFQVLVKDNGQPSLNNTANVVVNILDENDNAPYFEFPDADSYTIKVHYPSIPQNNITTVRALDNDSRENALLKYQITKGNQKQLFSIDQHSGQLSFNPIVTKSDAGLYNLQIVVKDSGYPVQSAMTTLSVLLTVANETAQSLSAVQITSDIKVHKNLVIVIVLIAMVLSVAVVVSVTLGIVQMRERFQIRLKEIPNDKRLSEQTQLTFFSRQSLPHVDCPAQKPEFTEETRHSRLFALRHEPDYWVNEPDEQKYRPSLKSVRTTNGNAQPHTKFVGGSTSPNSKYHRSRERHLLRPDYHSAESTTSSHTDSGYGWSEDNSQIESLYSSRYYVSQPYQSDLLQSSEYNRKVSQSMFNMATMTRENANSPFKYLYKPIQYSNHSSTSTTTTNSSSNISSNNQQNSELIHLKSTQVNHRRLVDPASPPWEQSQSSCSKSYSDISSVPPRPLPPLPLENQPKIHGGRGHLTSRPKYILQLSHSQLSHLSGGSPPTFEI